ncbi:MAG: ribbon-helix-helix protein, CopG family [Candidatus Lokiarchaeota archaeon]|nr:ribbon-helix-helix protein, CopG family [Candidatus Lokiarchaeota archaeon]
MAHFLEEYGRKHRFNDSDEELKEPMKNITINIPNQYDDIIQKLISLKLIPSRSEAIRIALKEFLAKEFETLDFIDLILKEKIENE